MAAEAVATGKETKNKQDNCCISHQFLNAATKTPNKIAIIHPASGAAQASKQLIHGSPPVYEGDQCFTFADVLASVDSLSCRIRSVLDGSDDPCLIRPHSQGNNICGEFVNQDVPTHVSQHLEPFAHNEEQPTDYNTYTPKILGLFMPPSAEYIIALLSVLRCGEAFLPLDPSWPKDRILSIISSSNADLIITYGDSPQWLAESSYCPVLQFSMEENIKEHICQSSFVCPCENGKQRLFCYVMYTSGSTGEPKGVCGSEQGLSNRFLWMQELYPVQGDELLLFKTSTSFVDHLQEIFGAILAGCTLVVPSLAKLKENIFDIINILQFYSITRLIAVPSLMRAILPALECQKNKLISSSLNLLVLSGEILPLCMWDRLRSVLFKTTILNLYGSTEVSGDCTYFDCTRLPKILETERLTSVPIGLPLSNCDVVLVGEGDKLNGGEICVSGLCVSSGYLYESTIRSLDHVKMHGRSICTHMNDDCGSQIYFRTGDFGQRLPSGELVFLGRKDRTLKLNGQRIALEEIENTLRRHSLVADAAVIPLKVQSEHMLLKAFILLKEKSQSSGTFRSCLRSWMIRKLPLAMIPCYFVVVESLPMLSGGKVDYELLAGFDSSQDQDEIGETEASDVLQAIKKAFSDVLAVEKVSDDDDFFVIGGNSIAAAHVTHRLGIDMRLLYKFPSPSKLRIALAEKMGLHNAEFRINWKPNLEEGLRSVLDSGASVIPSLLSHNLKGPLLRTSDEIYDDHGPMSKRLKMDTDKYLTLQRVSHMDGYLWNSISKSMSCSFSRCNMVLYGKEYKVKDTCHATWSMELHKTRTVYMQEMWKVYMESCVDASPLVVFKDLDVFLFIGSHSHTFICVDVKSGSVRWETILEGRIECSAAIIDDFSQVVVGCYKGKIYFLDFSNGNISWTFQTFGEVKCQPVVDTCRQLIWFGSHDHNLYALDYKSHQCVYKLQCGGSIFGSPAIDKVSNTMYVASTSGRLTAISIKALPFHTLWLLELEVPIFGPLALCLTTGNVICCLVDGHVLALNSGGSIIWKSRTGGPIFAGACTSHALPSQVLICSRNGSVYSFEVETGDLLWEYNVGDPITASAYIDENLKIKCDSSLSNDRLICLCTSSGTICLLRVNADSVGKKNQSREDAVQELARMKLQGDIFSSPVMICGRIFVGCRDDFLHCIAVEPSKLVVS